MLWAELLKKYNVNKPTADVYHDFLERIESANSDDAFPYVKNKVHRLNKWSRKIGKLTLKASYFKEVKLKRHGGRIKKGVIKARIAFMERTIQTYKQYINDTKQEFFSKYHAFLVKKWKESKKITILRKSLVIMQSV